MKRSGVRPFRSSSPFRPSSSGIALSAVAGFLLAGCGGGGGGSAALGIVGQELARPDGGWFFVDPNRGGSATRLHLTEMFWARLVDVHDQDEHGAPSPQPIYRDFAINENVTTNGDQFEVTTNPITQRTRLVIRRTRGAADRGDGTFHSLLRAAEQSLAPVAPKNDDGTGAEPFSYVARNAALVLRFDDLLQDGEEALRALTHDVRVLTGYAPSVPFAARIFFDPNHGALTGDGFHSTRVIVDLSVSETEASAYPVAIELNSDGLPPSLTTSGQPNVSVRIPCRLAPAVGQFSLLRGLSGAALSELENGPRDALAPTRDIVRALRAGNPSDANNGFLLDLNPPAIVGGWPLRVEDAREDLDGRAGLDWRIDLTFTTPCRAAPETGDIVSVGELYLQVRAPGSSPTAAGRVTGLRVRALLDEPITRPDSLLGQGLFLNPYDARKPVATGCWVTFTPPPAALPQTGISSEVQVLVRFTEPMDPASIDGLEGLQLVRGGPDTPARSDTIVIGSVAPSSDLRAFTFTPLLPLPHRGLAEPFHLRLGDFTDLAGNHLPDVPEEITFTIDPRSAPNWNSGLVLRFDELEEMDPAEGRDLRGQFFYDFEGGRLRPRPAVLQSAGVDRTNPVPSIMIPFGPGVQTPLSPLGSKLQAVWRYCDMGWTVRDETKYNVDVVGLSWSPIGGQAVRDYYEGFELRLAHSRFQPDECLDRYLLPDRPQSGLLSGPRLFADNILSDPASPQKIVHARALGYTISPADVFLGETGTPLLPFPLNRGGGPLASYTWRDTAVQRKAAPSGLGIPLCIEASRTLGLEPEAGTIAPSGAVPSFGLPLLMEFRCYPSDSGVGLNALDVSLAINSSAQPNFRAFSTGGINRNGTTVRVDPDLADSPRGGYDPASTPPGKATMSAENTFYIGQVDHVARVSRVHSAWYDTGAAADFSSPLVLPTEEELPLGTAIALHYRGANAFTMDAADAGAPFDAERMNAYGEMFFVDELGFTQPLGTVRFLDNVSAWTDDIDLLDGARYLQLRISFQANLDTGLTPELRALGVPYSFD